MMTILPYSEYYFKALDSIPKEHTHRDEIISLLIDQVLKLPFYKSLLAIKAGTQINKTVLSLMTQMRNITTASSFAMANGHLGSGASVADNFEMLWKEMVGKTDDPNALRALMDEALEMGALDNSTIARELEELIPELIGSSKVPNIKATAEKVIKINIPSIVIRIGPIS